MSVFLALLLATGPWLQVPGGTWEPDATSTVEAKASIETYVKEQARVTGKKLPDWSTYSFQYQGRDLQGLKVIYVNGFCTPIPSYADKKMVMVMDGGPCYFSAYYYPGSKRFIGVNFNGHG